MRLAQHPPKFAPLPSIASGQLTIDLDAVVSNYRALSRWVAPTALGAVVKADAYGLGAGPVSRALSQTGCRDFFVAHLSEAIAVKSQVGTARVYVLNGVPAGAEPMCADASVLPVLNTLDQVARWACAGRMRNVRLPAAVQLDTGMSRLGLSETELSALCRSGLLQDINLRLVLSHLASADEPAAPSNADQRRRFEAMRAMLPKAPWSLANSAASLLDPESRGDLARAGLALYGVHPAQNDDMRLAAVVRLEAEVIQTRELPAGAGVGYGLTYKAERPMRVATISAGYADGWPRNLGNRGAAYFRGVRLPIVGRVSMDSMTVDVTALGSSGIHEGQWVELIGPHQSLEVVAADAGTIAYEILTRLGSRYERQYIQRNMPTEPAA